MLRFPLHDNIELGVLMPHHALALSRAVQENVDHLARFLPFAHAGYDEDDARGFIIRSLENLAESEGLVWGLFHGEVVIGTLALAHWDTWRHVAEIGYWLAEDWQGHGLMTRAVRALTDYAFGTLGLNRLVILVDTANTRSQAIPARLGYTQEAIRRGYLFQNGTPRDMHAYVMLAEEWDGPATPGYQPGLELLRHPLGDEAHLALLMFHHAEACSALVRASSASLSRWIPWASAQYSEEEARAFIKRDLKKLAANNGMAFAIIHQGEFAGWIDYHYWNSHRRTELGYWLGEGFRGRGLMTRAIRALTDYAFNTLNLNRIDIHTATANTPSIKLAERAGYVREGVRRQDYPDGSGGYQDTAIYIKLAEQNSS